MAWSVGSRSAKARDLRLQIPYSRLRLVILKTIRTVGKVKLSCGTETRRHEGVKVVGSKRRIEDDVIPWCRENGVTMFPYGALCRGLLGGKLNAGSRFGGDDIKKLRPQVSETRLRRLPGGGGEAFGTCLAALRKDGAGAFREMSARQVRKRRHALGARRPEQLKDLAGVPGWKMDADSMNEIRLHTRDFRARIHGPGSRTSLDSARGGLFRKSATSFATVFP